MAANNLIHTTDDNFGEQVLKNDKPVVVDFFADWCAPCRSIAPLLEELATENEQVVIAKLDIDKNPKIPAKFGVRSIPTLVLYKNGEEQKRVVGADLNSIREMVSGANS